MIQAQPYYLEPTAFYMGTCQNSPSVALEFILSMLSTPSSMRLRCLTKFSCPHIEPFTGISLSLQLLAVPDHTQYSQRSSLYLQTLHPDSTIPRFCRYKTSFSLTVVRNIFIWRLEKKYIVPSATQVDALELERSMPLISLFLYLFHLPISHHLCGSKSAISVRRCRAMSSHELIEKELVLLVDIIA